MKTVRNGLIIALLVGMMLAHQSAGILRAEEDVPGVDSQPTGFVTREAARSYQSDVQPTGFITRSVQPTGFNE